MKINPRSKSSGQILVIVIILLVLLGIGFWWLDSNKRQMAQEGQAFGKKVSQELVVQHDMKFFDHLSPAMRLQYPPSAQQDLMTRLDRLGTPISPPDVQGDIQFQSHFFEPNGNFHAHINYPARGADINVSISHPVGLWQIDDLGFTAEAER